MLEKLLGACELTEFISIDLETTGLTPNKESIIEVSAVKYRDGKEKSFFTCRLFRIYSPIYRTKISPKIIFFRRLDSII